MTAITKRLERLTEAEIDDEIVVMLIDKGEFFSLSGTVRFGGVGRQVRHEEPPPELPEEPAPRHSWQ